MRIHTSKAPPTKGLAPRNCPNYSFVVFDNPNAVNQVMQDMVSSNCLLVLLLAYGRFQDVQLGYLVFRVCTEGVAGSHGVEYNHSSRKVHFSNLSVVCSLGTMLIRGHSACPRGGLGFENRCSFAIKVGGAQN